MCDFSVKGSSRFRDSFKAVGVFFRKSASEKKYFPLILCNITAIRTNFFAKLILSVEH